MSKNIGNPKALYKYLLRSCEKLPQNAVKHYKTNVKREFDTHRGENDQERITQIMDRAVLDAEWILKKYSKK